MNKRILYLTDVELFVYQVKDKTLLEIQRFLPGENGVIQFGEYLRKNRKTPLYCLVDSAQEEYQINLLPHVFGRDRRHLFALRMRRLFEYTSYTYAVVQGREKQGRGDDHVLFTALHSPELLQPWLDVILEQEIPLAGIYSLPLLSQNLLKQLPNAPYTLLVNHTPQITTNSPHGLRQSFFINQKLHMSRLIPLNTENSAEYARYIFDQIVKIQRHLENARLFAESNAVLSTLILTVPPFTSLLNTFLEKSPLPNYLQVHLIDTREFAHRLGLHTDLSHLFTHHLVAYQLAQRWWVSNHYARLTETRYFLYRRLRTAMYLSSVLFLASAATVASVSFNQAWEIERKGQQILQKFDTRQAELTKLRKEIPNLPLDILYIRNITDAGLYLKARQISPRPLWIEVSKILNRFPDLKLNQLEWGISDHVKELFQAVPSETLNKTPQEVSRRPENSEEEEAETEHLNRFYEGLRINGELTAIGNDAAQTSQLYNDFIKELHKKTDWKINEVIAPNNTNPLGVIEGQIGQPIELAHVSFTIDILVTHTYDIGPH